jgi:hypothetical protein
MMESLNLTLHMNVMETKVDRAPLQLKNPMEESLRPDAKVGSPINGSLNGTPVSTTTSSPTTTIEVPKYLIKTDSTESISINSPMNRLTVHSSSEPSSPHSSSISSSSGTIQPFTLPQQPPVISNNAEKFHSHFIKMRSPNRKGQTRYKCVTCGHEFECTGKLRLIQHILGAAYSGNQSKNVRSCPQPYLPLKEALYKIHGGQQQSTASSDSSQPNTPKIEPMNYNNNNTFNSLYHQSFKGVSANSMQQSSFIQPQPLMDLRLPINFNHNNESFYSNKSMDDNTTAEDCSRSDNEICDFLNGIGATDEDFINSDLPFGLDFNTMMACDSIINDEEASNANKNNKRLKKNEVTAGSDFMFGQQQQPKNRMYNVANKAVFQFFSNYRLPVNAVEDPLFLELLSAIRVAGPYYRPNMTCLLTDTQVPQPQLQQNPPQIQHPAFANNMFAAHATYYNHNPTMDAMNDVMNFNSNQFQEFMPNNHYHHNNINSLGGSFHTGSSPSSPKTVKAVKKEKKIGSRTQSLPVMPTTTIAPRFG